jgi:hypothetical protein
MVYFGVMVYIAPITYGANDAERIGWFVLATVGFLVVWRCLTKEHPLAPSVAFLSGLWAGVAIGIVEFALAVASSLSIDALIFAAAVEFGGIFCVLLGVLITRKPSGAGFLLTRSLDVGPRLALVGGMWSGAVTLILGILLLSVLYGVKGPFPG